MNNERECVPADDAAFLTSFPVCDEPGLLARLDELDRGVQRQGRPGQWHAVCRARAADRRLQQQRRRPRGRRRPAEQARRALPSPAMRFPEPAAGDIAPRAAGPSAEWLDEEHEHLSRLDRQHRRIIAVLERARYLEADDRLGMEQLLNVLTACVGRHFAEEEALLRQHGCPGGEERRREREWLLAEVRACRERLAEEGDGRRLASFESVWDWFARHITVAERQYEPFLRADGWR